MAKKKDKPKQTPWTANLIEMANKMTELNRAKRQEKERHVPKIPTATIFMNGGKVVLNND